MISSSRWLTLNKITWSFCWFISDWWLCFWISLTYLYNLFLCIIFSLKYQFSNYYIFINASISCFIFLKFNIYTSRQLLNYQVIQFVCIGVIIVPIKSALLTFVMYVPSQLFRHMSICHTTKYLEVCYITTHTYPCFLWKIVIHTFSRISIQKINWSSYFFSIKLIW